MKAKAWVALVTALVLPLLTARAQIPDGQNPPSTPAVPAVSQAAAEVIKMAQAGTGEDVLLGYVKNSTSTFDLTADQILYLRDIGISSPVITAMLGRDSELRNQPTSYTYDQRLYQPTTPAPETPAPVEAPASAPEPVPTPAPEPAQAPPPEPVQAPPPVYVSSPPPEVSYFYENLSPSGAWVQLDGVGWCWQPSVLVINHGWRPYCDAGHWVFTDAGWFWQSDYSWGWAPFHYGRWYLHDRCGWVWTPDRVWGPAWVTWRYEADHCGWAPLPPHADFDLRFGYRFNGVAVAMNFDFGLRPDHFTFIALRDFNDHDFARRRLPAAQVTQIYNHTTIINNYVVKNNVVVNQGIKVDRVAAATHTEFKKVAIRDTPAWSPANINPRMSGKAETAVYRPQLQAPARPGKMVAQKVDANHPVIQHAPVTPAKSPRPMVATSTGAGNRFQPAPNPVNSPWAPANRAPAYSEPQSTQRSKLPGNTWTSSRSGISALSSPRAESARPAAPIVRSEQTSSAPGRSSAPAYFQPNSSRPYYPLRSGGTSAETARPASQPTSYSTYRPKGYYQASETHALPPVAEARPSDSRGQPPAIGSRPGNAPAKRQQ